MQTLLFKDILPTLKDTSQIRQLELINEQGMFIDSIENVPGKSASVSIYYHVSSNGQINRAAAKQALQLYAEHTDDARQHPGKHPNIDRLFDLIDNNLTFQVKVINR